MKVEIVKMDHLGRGIGYIDGKVIFVPFTIIGDVVNVQIIISKKNFYEGKVISFIKKSIDRVEPFCKYFEKCGGCSLQNMSYDNTLKYKEMRTANILKRLNIDVPIEIVKNEVNKYYRNKIELKIYNGKLGYYEAKTHDFLDVDSCPIAKKCLIDFCDEIKKMGIKNGDVILRCNYNDELLIVINTFDNVILNDNNYPKYKVLGIILNNKCIYGEDHFLDKVGNFFFEVSYDSFFQVNSYVNEKLFSIIDANVKGDNVLDLYSGVGTLSIMASKSAKNVYAIEIIPNAVLNAIRNAKINNIGNVNFILGKVEDKIGYIQDKIDTVIVDPPRRGLDNVTINKILEINPNKIIYISCENQKLTEDLKCLLENYNVNKVYMLDMFSYSYHCESVVVLERIDK